MLKHILKIMVLLTFAAMFTGCDFFRTLAGRPTSADIETKRQIIEAAEAAKMNHAAVKDTADSTLTVQQDSVIVANEPETAAPAVQAEPVKKVEPVKQAEPAKPAKATEQPKPRDLKSYKYFVVVGVYSSEENVRRAVKEMEDLGYQTTTRKWGPEKKAVCILHSDTRAEADAKLAQHKDEFKNGAWVWPKE